ncbi:MAG: VCBS repeat-containing protein [Nannocystaceae bacterium]|nr:VCBS repeat-containing protein [Nannocystaceae bacterium]
MTRWSWLLLSFAPAACFGGEGTLGAACDRNGDCGAEQSCQRQICSLCGDGVAQAGEVCFDGPQPSEARPAGAVSFAFADVDGDGSVDLVWPGPDGLAVAALSGDGIAAAQERPFDVRAVWSGDIDGDGLAELLTRDSSGGAALWRPNTEGELLEVSGLDLEPLRGLTDAVVHPDFGIVGQLGSVLVRVGLEREPASVEIDGDITHLRAAPSLREGASFDVLVATEAPAFVPVFVVEDGLEAQAEVALPDPVLDVATTMWNGDPLGDAAVLYETGRVQVWLGTGGGAFVEGPGGAATLSSERIAVFDANADRLEDIVAYGPASGVRLLVRRGTELDDSLELDAVSSWWVAPVTLGPAPFADLALYDGTTLSILRSAP